MKIALADPLGAALHSFYTEGVLKAEGSSITEGIGQGRITANLEGFTPDFSFQIPDEEALPIVFDLVQEEGLCLGGSSGINIAGAIRLARELGPGPHHRDDPLRLRHALSVETVQSGIPALEEPAGTGLDGDRLRHRRAVRRGRLMGSDRSAVSRRRLSRRRGGDGRRTSTSAAASFSTARSSTRPRAASQATPVFWCGRTAADHDRGDDHRRDQGRDHPCPRTRYAAARAVGEAVHLAIDWERRLSLMRMHTACHLLTVVCPFPITGASVAEDDSRVDFDMPDARVTKEDVTRSPDGTGRRPTIPSSPAGSPTRTSRPIPGW